MHTLIFIRRAALLASIVVLCGFSVAEAQLGGLKRKLQKAAGEEATAETGVVAPPPKFDNVVLELTEPRLTVLLGAQKKIEAAYATMIEANRPEVVSARQTRQRKSEDDKQKFDDCVNRQSELEATRLEERVSALQAKGDMTGMMRIADSARKEAEVMMQDQDAYQRNATKRYAKVCGVAPERGASSADPQAVYEREVSSATGMTMLQFNTAVERLVPIMKQPKRRFDNPRVGGASESETKAIGGMYDDVKEFVAAKFASAY